MKKKILSFKELAAMWQPYLNYDISGLTSAVLLWFLPVLTYTHKQHLWTRVQNSEEEHSNAKCLGSCSILGKWKKERKQTWTEAFRATAQKKEKLAESIKGKQTFMDLVCWLFFFFLVWICKNQNSKQGVKSDEIHLRKKGKFNF